MGLTAGSSPLSFLHLQHPHHPYIPFSGSSAASRSTVEKVDPDQEDAQEDAVGDEDAERALLEIADQDPDTQVADDRRSGGSDQARNDRGRRCRLRETRAREFRHQCGR